MRSIFKGARVRDAMVTRFLTLSEDDPLELATQELIVGHQKDFPVTDGNQITGILMHSDLVKALSTGQGDQRVGDIVCNQCPIVRDGEPLDRAVDEMQAAGCTTLLVVRGDELVGLLTSEHLGDWAVLHAALRDRATVQSEM
jgi:predicted transcriptional regulator